MEQTYFQDDDDDSDDEDDTADLLAELQKIKKERVAEHTRKVSIISVEILAVII